MLDRYDQDLLLDYLEGELDADRRAKLDAMLAEDPQLAGLLNEMAMDRAALRALPEAQAPADLVHDVTKTLERRMLLDEPIDETGPIPLSRGRGLSPEPPRSINWGRVVGLTGLAASVALAAGIVVTLLDDPLERAADSLAASPTVEAAEAVEESDAAEDAASPTGAGLESITSEANRSPADIVDSAEGLLSDLAAGTVEEPLPGLDPDALARVPAPAATHDPRRPATTPELSLPGNPEAEAPLSNFAFGSTAAISVIQPRQQLVLLTESPEVSLEQLFEFCVANGIPIVQPKEQARLEKAGDRGLTNGPGATGEAKGAEATDDSYGDYALLINESQLDTLVLSLNNDVTIEPSRAGKASLISNQAAVLAELPEETSQRYGAAQARRAVVVEQQDNVDEAKLAAAEAYELAGQQAVQLRLPPDLGSDYANSRNAYNLGQTQQQGTYAQKQAVAEPADILAGNTDAPAPQPEPLAEADAQELEAAPADALVKEEKRNTAPKAAVDDRVTEGNAPAARESRINPTRGNWLSAHLPVADTTPLLLQWRTEQSAKPTSLVPVTIKRAEAEKVNTLRMRQQVELASRQEDAEAKPESQATKAGEEIEAESAAETDPPAEAPAKPAQPAE